MGTLIDLRSLLRLNGENSRSDAVHPKIIRTHFSSDVIDVQPFADIELKVMLYAISWMLKYCVDDRIIEVASSSLLYQFERSTSLIWKRH